MRTRASKKRDELVNDAFDHALEQENGPQGDDDVRSVAFSTQPSRDRDDEVAALRQEADDNMARYEEALADNQRLDTELRASMVQQSMDLIEIEAVEKQAADSDAAFRDLTARWAQKELDDVEAQRVVNERYASEMQRARQSHADALALERSAAAALHTEADARYASAVEDVRRRTAEDTRAAAETQRAERDAFDRSRDAMQAEIDSMREQLRALSTSSDTALDARHATRMRGLLIAFAS